MSRGKTTWRLGVLTGVLWVAAIAGGARAQGTGGLQVTVLDAGGEPLRGRTVVLRHNAARLEPQERTTDDAGTVEFPVLAAEGNWIVRVALDDVRAIERSVTVVLGGVTRVLVRLDDGPEATPVEAPGGSPDVETTAGVTRFPEAFVRELPIPGRFYQRVLPLAPGVRDADDDGNPRVHGSTSRDFRALVNGIGNVDPVTQQFMNFVNSESIEQLAVIPTGAGLQFGRAQGGFAAITQKIGTNEVAFRAGLRYRTSDLDGGNNGTDRTGDVEYRSVLPAVLVSGPIVKDRLWFRLAWERVDEELPVDVLSGLEIQTRDQTIQAYQLTWQASARHRLALQYQTDPLEIRGFGIDSSVPLASSQRLDAKSESLSLIWTVPWSSRLLVETTVALQDRSTRLGPEQPGQTNDCVTGDPPFEEFAVFLQQSMCTWGNNRTAGAFFRDVDVETDRWTLASRATWHIGRPGDVSHQLRMGFEFESDGVESQTTRATRSSIFARNSPFLKFDPLRQFLFPASVPLASPERDTIDATNWALYVEDRIRPVRTLVIDLGVRLDREEVDFVGTRAFDPAAENAAFQRDLEDYDIVNAFRDNFTAYEGIRSLPEDLEAQTDVPEYWWAVWLPNVLRQSAFWPMQSSAAEIVIRNSNVSPRLAVSWDPWSDGRNKFAASARRYYGSLLLAAPLLASEAPEVSMLFNLEESFRGGAPVLDDLEPSRMAIDVEVVDDELDTPYQDEWRLAYERELWKENRLRVEYVNRKYRDQLQFDEINRQPGDFGRCLVASLDDPRTLIASPGSGFEVRDPFTGDVYVDDDPGDGDGRIDDCEGAPRFIDLGEYYGSYVERPDGRADEYVQNPAWGSIRRLTNDGRRDYEAFVVEFVRRQFRGWGMQASYVWSRFEGSAEPLDPYVGFDRGLENLAGFDSSDQRHVVKVATNGVLRGDWHLGGVVSWQSGLPFSEVRYALDSPAVLPAFLPAGAYGQTTVRTRYLAEERNGGRNAERWLVDLRAAKGFALGGRWRLEVALDVFNLLDDRPYQIYNPDTEIGLVVNGVASARRAFGRSFQLGLRVSY